MILLDLFLGFLRVGCFSFGGAYGAIPLIRDVVYYNDWLTDEALSYMIAVSESTPGPIMVNLATYVGSSQAGLPGALLATLAVVLPSFVVILLVCRALRGAIRNKYVQAVLRGVKPCLVGIVLATGIYMMMTNILPDDYPDVSILLQTMFLAAVLFCSSFFMKKKISPIAFILLSAVLGILVYGI